ncbi:hypothetical protein B0H14DRAFT_3161383 [Mycena olivaceomarginata]|nr:hypothetical protein B0H14DRAFT_3161383 [Mycena olivaceomarginata]
MLAYTHLLATVFALGQVGLALPRQYLRPRVETTSSPWRLPTLQSRAVSTRAPRGGLYSQALSLATSATAAMLSSTYMANQKHAICPALQNASEFCGGPNALNLYQFSDTPFTTGPASTVLYYKRWVWWGCMNELFPLPPKRLLPHAPLVPIPGEQMTVERCLDGCAAAGYNAAALETGQECYCDLATQPQPPGWESTNWFECARPVFGERDGGYIALNSLFSNLETERLGFVGAPHLKNSPLTIRP